jgi:hypothetical protein
MAVHSVRLLLRHAAAIRAQDGANPSLALLFRPACSLLGRMPSAAASGGGDEKRRDGQKG